MRNPNITDSKQKSTKIEYIKQRKYDFNEPINADTYWQIALKIQATPIKRYARRILIR